LGFTRTFSSFFFGFGGSVDSDDSVGSADDWKNRQN
jgi:hypothetical protein